MIVKWRRFQSASHHTFARQFVPAIWYAHKCCHNCKSSVLRLYLRYEHIHTHTQNRVKFNFQLYKRYKLIWYHQFWFCFEHPFCQNAIMPLVFFSLCANSFDFCRSDLLHFVLLLLLFCFGWVCASVVGCCLYEQHHSFFRCSVLRWHNGSNWCYCVCQWYATEQAEGNLINNFIKHFCWNTMCYATKNFHCAFQYGHQNSLAWSVQVVISVHNCHKIEQEHALCCIAIGACRSSSMCSPFLGTCKASV